MAKQTLTAKKFQELLEAHPRFHLGKEFWTTVDDNEKPCGGCALTLAYYHETKTPVAKLDHSEVVVWAEEKYGEDYTNEFIYGFDSPEDAKLDNPSTATKHGIACHKLAVRMGRLN